MSGAPIKVLLRSLAALMKGCSKIEAMPKVVARVYAVFIPACIPKTAKHYPQNAGTTIKIARLRFLPYPLRIMLPVIPHFEPHFAYHSGNASISMIRGKGPPPLDVTLPRTPYSIFRSALFFQKFTSTPFDIPGKAYSVLHLSVQVLVPA